MPQVLAGLGVCVALFGFWTLLGTAIAVMLNGRRADLKTLLVAPACGLAILVISVLLVTRAGLPMQQAGIQLGLVLLLACLAVLWRLRPASELRLYAPFAAVFLAAVLLTGRPMLQSGLGWLSFANDDMANYVLGASLLSRSGFANAPDYAQLIAGQDYAQFYWFTLVPGGARPGSELLLAWVTSITGLSGHQVFMPVILALHASLISAAGALVYSAREQRLAAWATCAVLAASALTSLGALFQLIAQVAGLGLLVASLTLLVSLPAAGDRGAMGRGVLAGLTVAALLLVYPEVSPFLALGFSAYWGVALLRRRLHVADVRNLALVVGTGALTSVVLVNSYLLRTLNFLLLQLRFGLEPTDTQSSIFPYFLLPSGLADLWGLQTITDPANEPWMSLSIVIGAALLGVAVVTTVAGVWRGEAAAMTAAIMLALGARLLSQQSGFGLFKLAMYIQPFLVGTLVVAWIGSGRPRWRLLPVAAVGIASLVGQTVYVERSRGLSSAVANNAGGLVQEFRDLIASVAPGPLVLDTPNIALAKIEALYTEGRTVTFPNRDFFGYIIPPDIWSGDPRVEGEIVTRYLTHQFSLLDPHDATRTNEFVANTVGVASSDGSCAPLVWSTGSQTIFNRWHSPAPTRDFAMDGCDSPYPHLTFVHSQLGLHYYEIIGSRHFAETLEHIGIFPIESDVLRKGETMAGVGRYLMFEVEHASGPIRLLVDLSSTLKGDGQNQLPRADAIGATREALPLVGRGSARVVSQPLMPQSIDGHDYVAIDMGQEGSIPSDRRSGLMALYGRDRPLDWRRVVAFARDVSAVSEADYAAMRAPARIDDFPLGLADPNLEYSGIYEDGWVSDTAYMRLEGGANPSRVVVRGSIPVIEGQSLAPELTILVNGNQVGHFALQPGDFEVGTPLVNAPGPCRVELRFSQIRSLPDPDNRPIAAHLRSVTLEAADAPGQTNDIVRPASGMAVVGRWNPVEQAGGETFRWVDNDAELAIGAADGRAGAELALNVEPGPGAGSRPLLLQVLDSSGDPLTEVSIAGRETLVVPAEVLPAGDQTIRLHVLGGGQPTPGDPRILNFRVFWANWVAPATARRLAELSELNAESDIGPADARAALQAGRLPTDGLFVGENWYPLETFGGEQFRWVANDAEIVVASASSQRRPLRLKVEPGAGVSVQPFTLDVLDAQGRVVTSAAVAGRQIVDLPLPTEPGQSAVFRLHVDGGGAAAPNDARTLNFRVFAFDWAQ